VSPELRLIVAPRETYAALRQTGRRLPATASLRRPLLVALVTGVSIALASTRSASAPLVASTTLTWSYIVLLQLAIALPLVAPAARRTVGVSRAVDLYFAGHAPWSLFLLAAAAWAPSPGGRPSWPLYLAALVPVLLTPRIVNAFFAEVLAMDRLSARRMTILQQAMTWSVFVAVNWIASAFTPRLYELASLW